jgi:hypothetical protein
MLYDVEGCCGMALNIRPSVLLSSHHPECVPHFQIPLPLPPLRGMSHMYPRLDVQAFDNATFFQRVLPDALAELKSLANIIQTSVAQIESVVAANSFTLPSSESTFTPESEGPRMHPDIQSAAVLIASAAAQIATLVRPAPLTLLDTTMQVSLEVFFFSRPWIVVHPPGNDAVPCLYRATHGDRDPCT